MIIKELFYDNNGTARGIILGESGIEYSTAIANDLYAWCTCPFFVYKSIPCKHIHLLNGNLEKEKMVDKSKSLKYLETGSKIIDDMLGGGIPYGIVTALFGEPMVGKSLLGYQIALANLNKTKKNTLIIDTEGLRDVDLHSILGKFSGRWNLDMSDIKSRIKIIHTQKDPQLQSIQKLLQLFGYMVTFEISKQGKYSMKFQHCKETLTLEELNNTSMIILDSLTKPIKDSVGSETQNLPARAQLVERLFGKLYQIAQLYNIAVVITHHATINPITPFGRDLGKPYGGNPILYNSKYVLQFIDAPKKMKEETGWNLECRRIRMIRRPDEQTTGELIPIRLKKDWGFCDE